MTNIDSVVRTRDLQAAVTPHDGDTGAPDLGQARVAELIRYPIKGCAGVPAPDATVTPAGLLHDRSFMVVGADGVFRSQRTHPRLALIRPDVTDDGARLTLRASAFDTVHVEVDLTGARRDVDLFGTPYFGIDQGDGVAEWLSDLLGAPSRLVRVPPEHARVTDGLTQGTSGYADSSPVHLISVSSLAELNRRIVQRGEDPVPMSRFRPNIVVNGWRESALEDRARTISIGDAELGYSKLAIRCAVTLVDQESGARAGREPIRTLADYRRATGGGVAFGAKFAVTRPGTVSVGEGVAVTSWGVTEL